VSKRVLLAMPRSCWAGHRPEVVLNETVRRLGGKRKLVLLRGVSIRSKGDKFGFWPAQRGYWRMFREVFAAERCMKKCGSCVPTP